MPCSSKRLSRLLPMALARFLAPKALIASQPLRAWASARVASLMEVRPEIPAGGDVRVNTG
jgi:hypothetical protein